MTQDTKIQAAKPGLLRIIILVVVVAAIAFVWILKNSKSNTLPEDGSNSEFSLNVGEDFDIEKLKSYGLPIIIDFGAEYCGPCREMAPVLEKLNKQLQGKAIIKFVDVSRYQNLAQKYPVRVIPTQVLIDKDGKPFTPSGQDKWDLIMYSSKQTNEHLFTIHEGPMTEKMMLDILKEMGMEND